MCPWFAIAIGWPWLLGMLCTAKWSEDSTVPKCVTPQESIHSFVTCKPLSWVSKVHLAWRDLEFSMQDACLIRH